MPTRSSVPPPPAPDRDDPVQRIAAEVGVSPRTVRRCLSGAVASYGATRRRMADIRQVAERIGYRPNPAARALRGGRFSTVAVLGSDRATVSHLPAGLLKGLAEAVHHRGLRLSLIRADDATLNDPAMLRPLLKSQGADGLLLDYLHHVPKALARTIQTLALPAVWLNREVPHDGVRFADDEGAAAVTGVLLRHGHRRIAYVDFSHPPDDAECHYSARQRQAGWAGALAAAGLQGPILRQSILGPQRLDAARAWLRSLPTPPDAVVAYASEHAAILLHAAALEGIAGLGAAAVGVVDEATVVLGSACVTYQLPTAEMGRQAVDLLLRKVEAPAQPLPSVIVPGVLVVPERAG